MSNPNPDLTGLADNEVPDLMTGTWPLKLRSFVARRLELLFVVLILGMVLTVFFLIPYKIAFLNLFYLPVLSAAYFIGKRKAVLGSVLCILVVLLLAILYPEWFALPATT